MWEFVGEFDMVYKPFWNWGFNLVERSRKTLRHSFSHFKAGLRKLAWPGKRRTAEAVTWLENRADYFSAHFLPGLNKGRRRL